MSYKTFFPLNNIPSLALLTDYCLSILGLSTSKVNPLNVKVVFVAFKVITPGRTVTLTGMPEKIH